jgi:urate oxidase
MLQEVNLFYCLKIYLRGKSLYEFEKGFRWNGVIRFYLESFLEVTMSSFINLLRLEWDSAPNIICSAFSIFFVFLSAFFPMAMCYELYKNHDKLEEENHLHVYGALYEPFKRKKWFHYMHNLFFFVRRILYIIILVFMYKWPLIQLIAFQIKNFLVNLYNLNIP